MFLISAGDFAFQSRGPVLAYFTLTLGESDGTDGIMIHDCRLVKRENLRPLVAFPDRPKYQHCKSCNTKCSVNHNYCFKCGRQISNDRLRKSSDTAHYAIVHPTNSQTRTNFEDAVLKAYEERKKHDLR